MSSGIAESIGQLIAGRFGYISLCQLHTKLRKYNVLSFKCSWHKGLHGQNVLQSVDVHASYPSSKCPLEAKRTPPAEVQFMYLKQWRSECEAWQATSVITMTSAAIFLSERCPCHLITWLMGIWFNVWHGNACFTRVYVFPSHIHVYLCKDAIG